MAEKTATPIDIAQRTSVGSLTSWLFEKHNTSGPTRWLLRAGVYHRTRRSFGQQYCPRCLAEGEAYYRLSWRFAWVTACERHRSVLLDRCPKCRQPVMFHRPAMNLESIVYCGACQFDLRKADASWEVVDAIALKFQAQNIKILEQGWTVLGDYPIQYSFSYFDIVHQLARILSSGQRAEALRSYVSRKWGGDPTPVIAMKTRAEMELLGPSSRHRTLGLTGRLIRKWPNRFLEACQASNSWNSWALKDETRPAFPLWHPVRSHAYKPLYTPSQLEISSARQHLIRLGQKPGPRALKRLLGVDSKKFLSNNCRGNKLPLLKPHHYRIASIQDIEQAVPHRK